MSVRCAPRAPKSLHTPLLPPAYSVYVNSLLVSGTRWIQFYKATTNSEVKCYKPTFLGLAFL